MGPSGGEAVAAMVSAFLQRRELVVTRLNGMRGVELSVPDGAFYVFPRVDSFYGLRVEGFGEIDGSDALCRFLLQEAQVKGWEVGRLGGWRVGGKAGNSCERSHDWSGGYMEV